MLKICCICQKEFETKVSFKKCEECRILKCVICGELILDINYSKSYCSEKCKKEAYQQRQKKAKKTNLERYGVEVPAQSAQIQDKIKKTMFEKYGVENIAQSKEHQDKIKQTNLERYGVENVFQSKEIRQKSKQTLIARYGVDHPMHSEKLKAKCIQSQIKSHGTLGFLTSKTKKTLQEKYGVDHNFKIADFRKKRKQKMIELYGAEFTMQSDILKQKRKKTMIEKYGTDSVGEIRSKFSEEEFLEFISEWNKIHDRKPTLKDLSERFGYTWSNAAGARIRQLNFSDCIDIQTSSLELTIKQFLNESGLKYIQNDRMQIKPFELDFYLPEYNLAIEVNDFLTHNSTFHPWANEPKDKNYHLNKTKTCREKGIRLIHAWENYITDETKWQILKNAILHACGLSENKVFARNCRVQECEPLSMKKFFNENNIAGYRGAKIAYVLVDNKTNEPVMCYLVGYAHFGKGKYDAEIIRGASKIGYTIVGGASKLWKHIIENTNYNSIVYYVDLNLYNGSSMEFLDGVETISELPSFKNYYLGTRKLKNREPSKHKEIVDLTEQGKIWAIWDAGVQVNVWHRKGEK
jgi:predicted nucleic acid-binding Zn ribbon protein